MALECFKFFLELETVVLGKIAGGTTECQRGKGRIYKASLS